MVVPGGSTKDDLFLGSNHRACDVNAYHTHSKTVAFIDMHSSATNGFVVQVEVQTSYEKNKKSTNLIEFLFCFLFFFPGFLRIRFCSYTFENTIGLFWLRKCFEWVSLC